MIHVGRFPAGSAATPGLSVTYSLEAPVGSDRHPHGSISKEGNVLRRTRIKRWLSVGVVLGSFAAASPVFAQGIDGLPAYPWDLSTCLEIARTRNLDLAQAEAQTYASRGSYRRSLGQYLPSVSSGFSWTRVTNDRVDQYFDPNTGQVVEAGTRTSATSYELSASLRQPIVDLEAIHNIKGSRIRLDQSRMGLETAHEQLDLDVTQSYYDLLKAFKSANLAEEAVDLAKEQLRRTESLYDLGSVPRADVLQSRVAVARNELELISARKGVRESQAELALVLGFPSDLAMEIDTTVTLPALEREWDESRLWEWAREDRADLREVVLAAQSADAQAQAARWSRWPTLDLTLFYSGQDDQPEKVLTDVTTNASWGARVALNANLNILDQFLVGSTVGSVEEAEWTRRQEQWRLEKKELEVRLDIRRAVLAWGEARERLAMSQENVRYAEENLRLQRALYEAGGGTILEWNNAQVELTRARNELLQAEVDLLTALASLERSVGRPVQ